MVARERTRKPSMSGMAERSGAFLALALPDGVRVRAPDRARARARARARVLGVGAASVLDADTLPLPLPLVVHLRTGCGYPQPPRGSPG